MNCTLLKILLEIFKLIKIINNYWKLCSKINNLINFRYFIIFLIFMKTLKIFFFQEERSNIYIHISCCDRPDVFMCQTFY